MENQRGSFVGCSAETSPRLHSKPWSSVSSRQNHPERWDPPRGPPFENLTWRYLPPKHTPDTLNPGSLVKGPPQKRKALVSCSPYMSTTLGRNLERSPQRPSLATSRCSAISEEYRASIANPSRKVLAQSIYVKSLKRLDVENR